MLKFEALEPKTRIIFDKLAEIWCPFPLVWWTGLSLQIGHRKSIDLDFVANRLVTFKDIQIFKKLSSKFEIVYSSNEQIDMFADGVKITLFSYRRKEHFPFKSHKKLKIRDIKDIAMSKASTIWRREEMKDYIDLYVILRQWILSLEELITSSQKKFKWEFSEKLFLKQLLLVKDIENYDINFIGEKIWVEEMHDFFHELVEKRLNSK